MKFSFDKEWLERHADSDQNLKSPPARSRWTRYRGQRESQRVIRQPNHA